MDVRVYPVLVDSFVNIYSNTYNLKHNSGKIKNLINGELTDVSELNQKANDILEKKFDEYVTEKGKTPLRVREVVPGKEIVPDRPFISALEAFEMYSSLGIPKEKIFKFIKDKGFIANEMGFEAKLRNALKSTRNFPAPALRKNSRAD